MGNAVVDVLLVGIGGYGNTYVSALLDEGEQREARIAGIVDPFPEGCRRLTEIRNLQIPIYRDVKEFYARHRADLAIVASPIHFHSEQTCQALQNGSNVICEKPVSATIQEARLMEETAKKADRFLAIGYQWSYSDAIQRLKRDVMQGKLGRPLRLRTIVLWPRNAAYYRRGQGWAGRKRDQSGRWILDSVANNATAHYLHNMFYILGQKKSTSARPYQVEAELYRANDIENFDTAMLRVMTCQGAELLFYATHAVKDALEPSFVYEFAEATVYYGQKNSGQYSHHIEAIFKDGTVKDYGDPNTNRVQHLWMAVGCIKRGEKLNVCGVDAALSHTICINSIQEAIPQIPRFPSELVQFAAEEELTWVRGLREVMIDGYQQGKLPNELAMAWAQAASIKLDGYQRFPQNDDLTF